MDVLNASQNFSESPSHAMYHHPSTAVRVLWLTGISTSILGLFLQMALLWLLPKCRRYDEFVLFQLTLVRVMNTSGEFVLVFNDIFVPYHLVIFWNFYTDLSLACWMFVFTKNLFYRIVLVFVDDDRYRLVVSSTLTWFVPVPLAFIAPYVFRCPEISIPYYVTFSAVKLIIASVNGLLFIIIFRVAIIKLRSDPQSRTLKELLKITVVTFLLSCISSLQVLVTDLLSLFHGKNYTLIDIFCVLNSYHVCAMTIIFLILVKNSYNKPLIKTIVGGVRNVFS